MCRKEDEERQREKIAAMAQKAAAAISHREIPFFQCCIYFYYKKALVADIDSHLGNLYAFFCALFRGEVENIFDTSNDKTLFHQMPGLLLPEISMCLFQMSQ